MAQSVKHPTVDFSSVHDLLVHGIEPALGSALTADSTDPVWDSLSPCLSAPHFFYLLTESVIYNYYFHFLNNSFLDSHDLAYVTRKS